MKIVFMPDAWDDYLYWQAADRRLLKKLNTLIKECQRTPFTGSGKPSSTNWLVGGPAASMKSTAWSIALLETTSS